MNDYTSNPEPSGIDVPLSVWPIRSQHHLIECLVEQFTAEGDTVALMGLAGVSAVVECDRNGVIVCDPETAINEHAALMQNGQSRGTAIIAPVDATTAFARIASIRDAALTICAPRPVQYIEAWKVMAATIRPSGLLAVVWNGPFPPDAAASCEEAGLSYAGHIVAAEAGEFDLAAATAERLQAASHGRSRRAHINISLWARYPEQTGGGL